MKFWILWGFDALVALVFIYFFFIGLLDGSVSSFNMRLWLTILGVLAGLMGGTAWLKMRGHGVVAACFLSLLAAPALFYLLFIAVVLINPPRWN